MRTNKELEILDTPGILWPKFEDDQVGLKLALTGAIKDKLLPMDDVTIFGLQYFLENYQAATMKRLRMKNRPRVRDPRSYHGIDPTFWLP